MTGSWSLSLWRLVALALVQLLAPGCSAGYVHPAPRTCTPIGALASGGQPSSVHSLCRPADGSCTTSDGERLCSLDLVIRGTSNGANGIPTCACAFVQNCNRRVPWLLEPGGGGAPPTTMQVGICDNSAPVMAAMVMVPLLVVVALMIMCAPVDSVVKARLRQYDRYARTWLTQKGLLTGKAAYVPPQYEKWRVRRHSPTSIVLRGIHHTLGGELGRDEGPPDGRAGAPDADGRLDRNHIYPLDSENIGGQWSWPRKRLPNDPSAWLNTERPLRRGGEGRSTTDLTTASSRSRSFRPRNVESDRALVIMHHDSVSIVNQRRKPRRRRGEEEPPTSSDDDEYGYSGYGYGYGYDGYGDYGSSDGEGSDGADGDDGSGGEGLASEGRDSKRRVRAEGGDTGAAAVMEQGGGSSATDTVAAEEGGTAGDGTPAADKQEDAQPVEAEQSPAGQGGRHTRRRGSRSGYSKSGYSGYSGSRGYGYSRSGYSHSGYSSDEYSSDDEVSVHAVRVVLTLTAFPREVFGTEYHHALRVGVAKAVSALANNLDEEIVGCHADAAAVAQVSSAAAAVLAKLKEHAPIRSPEPSTPRAVPEAPGAANDAESSDLEAQSPDPATTAGWGCPRLLADAETGDGGGPGEAWASLLDGVHIVRVRSVGGAEALKRARHSRKKDAVTAAGLALIAAKRSGRGWRRIAAKRAAEAAAVPVVPTMHTITASNAVGVASNAIVAFGDGGKIESGSGKAVTPAAPAPAPGKGLAQTIGNVFSRSLARVPAQAKKSAKVAPEARVVPDSQEDNGGDGDGSEGSGYGSAYSGSGYGGSGSGYGYNSSDSDYDYDYDYGYAPSVSSEDEDHVEEDDNEPRNWPGSAGMYDMPDAIAGQEQRTKKKKKKKLRLADRVPGLGTQVEIEIETAVGPVLSSTDDEWEEGDHLAARHAMRKRYHQRAVARTHGLARALGLEEGGDGQLLADQGTAPLVVVKPVKRQPFHDEGYHERHVAYENRKAAKATADASAATLRETFQHALGTSLMGAGMPLRHPRKFAKSAFVRDTTQFAFKYDLSKVEDWVDPEEEEGEYSDEEGKGEVAEITYNETELDFRSSQQPMPRGFYLAEKGKWRLPGQEWDLRPLQDPHERIRRGKPNTVALDSLHAAGDKAHRSKMTVSAELAAVGHARHGVAHSKRQHTLAAALHADRATAVAAADAAAATAAADAAAAKNAAPDPAADATLEDVDGGTDDEVEGEPTDTLPVTAGSNADADGDAGRSDEDPVDVADDEVLATTALKAKGGAWFAPNLQRWMLPAEGLEPAALRPDAEYNSAVRVERRQQRRADAAKKRDFTTVGAEALAGLRAGTDVRLTFVGRGVPPEYTQELLEAEVASVVAPARRKKWLGGGDQDPAGTPRPYDFFFMPTDPDPHTRRPKGHGAGSNGLGYFIVNFLDGEAMARFFDAMNGRRWELGVLGTKVLEAKAAAKAGAGKKGKAAAVSTKLGDGGPEGAHSHCLLLFAPVQGRKAQQAEVARWQKHAGGAWKSAQKRQQKALAGQQGRRPSFFGGIVGSAGAGNNTPHRRRSWVNDWGAPMLYDPAGKRQGQ